MQLFDLSGQTAIVTGSSRGIGKAIALRLAEHGARVAISSRKAAACEAAAAEINALIGAPRAVPIAANISIKDDIENLVTRTREQLGPIDILVCNAATNPYYGPMSGIDDAVFEKILRNNIISNHWLAQAVAPDQIARGGGATIIVSSIGALQGTPVLGAYNISKAGDLALARNLACELGPHNIRVNCICPGLIKTDFAKALWSDPKALRQVTEGVPLGRIGEPDDIAGCAVFLASPAGRFATGQQFIIDGGVLSV